MTASGRMYGIAEVVNGKAYIGAGWRLDNGSAQSFFFDFYQTDPVTAANISGISKQRMSIYPNPATDYVQVDAVYSDATYTLTDITGRAIKNGTISGNRIHISDMAP